LGLKQQARTQLFNPAAYLMPKNSIEGFESIQSAIDEMY